MNISDKKLRFYIYGISLLPIILLMGTGVIMLNYHAGESYEAIVMGQNGYYWLSFHKVISLVTIPLVLLHLLVKSNWVKNFFMLRVKGKFNRSNIILFITFSLSMISSFGSWIFFNNTDSSNALGGMHSKFGLLLIIMLGIHIWNYRLHIIHQFKKSRILTQ